MQHKPGDMQRQTGAAFMQAAGILAGVEVLLRWPSALLSSSVSGGPTASHCRPFSGASACSTNLVTCAARQTGAVFVSGRNSTQVWRYRWARLSAARLCSTNLVTYAARQTSAAFLQAAGTLCRCGGAARMAVVMDPVHYACTHLPRLRLPRKGNQLHTINFTRCTCFCHSWQLFCLRFHVVTTSTPTSTRHESPELCLHS